MVVSPFTLMAKNTWHSVNGGAHGQYKKTAMNFMAARFCLFGQSGLRLALTTKYEGRSYEASP